MAGPSSPLVSLDAGGRWKLQGPLGRGSVGEVFAVKERATGVRAALKLGAASEVAREARLLARAAWRWGPKLLDAGMVAAATPGSEQRAFLIVERAVGAPLDPALRDDERPRIAAVVAHGVGRALAELHDAGIRHGDVKPSNILVAGELPRVDEATDRGATLIDLSLGDDFDAPLRGGTPRYLAPEVLAGGSAGPAADVFALGQVLAEVLGDGGAARHAAGHDAIAPWVFAMAAANPGARPSAAWIAERAAAWLGLRQSVDEPREARLATVRRSYLALRHREIGPASELNDALSGPSRAWLEEAIGWARRVGGGSLLGVSTLLEPLGAIDLARWVVALVGPCAAAWPIGELGGEAELAQRLLSLAREREPAAFRLDELRDGVRAEPREDDEGTDPVERIAHLVRELGRARPHPASLRDAEELLSRSEAPRALRIEVASAHARSGEYARAQLALAAGDDDESLALGAEVARRLGDAARARLLGERAAHARRQDVRVRARATLARLAWDAGALDEAAGWVEKERGPLAAEMRALVAYARGDFEGGLAALDASAGDDGEADSARRAGMRGLLEHARGRPEASFAAFRAASELATRAGALVDEATYRTGEAAAACDAGFVAQALGTATRAALLWERLGRPADAARAWLSRAGAFALVGAVHATDEAAAQAQARAVAAGDRRARAFSAWVRAEVRELGDARAEELAAMADDWLDHTRIDDDARAVAHLVAWAPSRLDGDRAARVERALSSPTARWEYWGAQARALVHRGEGDDGRVRSQLLALLDVPAPISAKGPALAAAVELARKASDGDAARRFETERRALAALLRAHTPASLLASLETVAWARLDSEPSGLLLAPGQISELETIVRALSGRERLRDLFEQVLDTMLLWTGVERGLFLLRAPDGRLVPRAARNLARADLRGEQLALSQTLAQRALATGEAVVATDALASLGESHASVHALRLRSVLVVPLVARGEHLGVVYLDDRARRGAFGQAELAWVRLLASQAALAIADARDQLFLRRAVRRAARANARLEELLATREAELSAARAEIDLVRGDELRGSYDGLIGRSEAMRAMLRLVDRFAQSDLPVLLLGESGTGKELVARAIHTNGPRRARAFVTENCASVPESLLESALFGHVKGSFTGASATRPGLFVIADGGTLFLDEIGEMSMGMQAKLLRVLQNGEVRAVGAERTRTVDVRVLAATHRDLATMVRAGTFREDLYYRLNVVSVAVPALRDRPDDIPLLVAHFLEKHSRERALRVAPRALDRLVRYRWPGNVRQLENEIRRAAVLAEETIDLAELSKDVLSVPQGGGTLAGGLRARLDGLERELIGDALAKTQGNQTRAAELLGISRFGLLKMQKRLGLDGDREKFRDKPGRGV